MYLHQFIAHGIHSTKTALRSTQTDLKRPLTELFNGLSVQPVSNNFIVNSALSLQFTFPYKNLDTVSMWIQYKGFYTCQYVSNNIRLDGCQGTRNRKSSWTRYHPLLPPAPLSEKVAPYISIRELWFRGLQEEQGFCMNHNSRSWASYCSIPKRIGTMVWVLQGYSQDIFPGGA